MAEGPVRPGEGILERRLKARPIADPVQRATMNLQIAAAHLEEDLGRVTATEGLSTSALNVLRILRGQPEGHPRLEISARMIYRNADVTRIVDRLTRRGLVERVRSTADRRLSVTRITKKGLQALQRLDDHIRAFADRYRRKMSARDYGELNRLLEAMYADDVE